MKSNIDVLLNIAEDEVGYLEKRTNAFLTDKTANAGANNYTKYGEAQGCNGQPWCDAFVDWCFVKAYGKERAERLLCGFSNYTPTSAGYFKKKGLFVRTRPQKGDVIFFANATRICHTGIVYKVTNNSVYTIEGNTSKGSTVIANGGGVAMKSYALNYSAIAGYGRPNYEDSQLPYLYKGCYGVAVGDLQMRLNKKLPHGKIAVDNDFGCNTFNKLVEYQALIGMDKTGECTSDVWRVLYE